MASCSNNSSESDYETANESDSNESVEVDESQSAQDEYSLNIGVESSSKIDQEGSKSEQNTESSSEKDDLSLANWIKPSPKTSSSRSKSEEITVYRKRNVPPPPAPTKTKDVIGDAYQWDSYFLTNPAAEVKWECPEKNAQSWCENIRFANNALKNYFKFIQFDDEQLNGTWNSEDESLSKLALKPSFLDPEDQNIMSVKSTLINAYHYYSKSLGNKGKLPEPIDKFENRENCKRVMKLTMAFEELSVKLKQKKSGHFGKLKNVDTINKYKKLKNALLEVKKQMSNDGGYCTKCIIPDPDQIKLDFGAKIVKNLKKLKKKWSE
ncbi:hypothetical protein niasHT_030060 [Heterodera trifolii]|uniref:Uncharacterized protein n=1 Tax=Heterodera trifolii TaxID=157864 RepID=A0ABD2JQI2_9BILA